MAKKVILTGDRPTGRLHIGHYIGSLKNRVELQNSGEYEPFVMIADTQALTDNANDPEKIRHSLLEVALDYLAVGIDPDKTTTFNRTYHKDVLVEPEGYFPPKGLGRLPGIDGNAKMSKSLNNGIYLADDADTVQKKIMSMYTDPNHIHVSDPGKVEGNVVFTYLDIFDPDKDQVAKLKEQYQHGGLGDVKIKRYLIDVMEAVLEPIRTRRAHYAEDMGAVAEMLQQGSAKANVVANQTLQEVRDAIGFNYFK